MRFEIRQHEGEWGVFDQDSQTLLITAEGLSLEDVNLTCGRMVATIKAAHGVTVMDYSVEEDPHLIKAIGIGRYFKGGKAIIPFFLDDTLFRCSETNRPLHHARRVLLFHTKMYYSMSKEAFNDHLNV